MRSYLPTISWWGIITAVILHLPDPAFGLSTGNNFQKFSPTSSGVDFITTESSYPTRVGHIVFGTTLDYGLFVMPVVNEEGIDPSGSQDNLTSAHSYVTFGFNKDIEFQLKLPLILFSQSLNHPADKGEIRGWGLSYMGGGGKYRFFKQSYYELAVGAEAGVDLMKSNPYIGADMIPFGTSIYLATTADYDPLILGVNLGYRFRTVGEAIKNESYAPPPIQPVAHTLLFSTALMVNSGVFGNLIGEVYGSHALINPDLDYTDRGATSLEYLVGFTKFFPNGVGVKVGAGSEFFHGIGTAKFRLVAGVDYAFDAQKAGWISPPKRQAEDNWKMPPDPFDEDEEDDESEEKEGEEGFSDEDDFPGSEIEDDELFDE